MTEMPPGLNCYVTLVGVLAAAGEAERAVPTSRASRTDVANTPVVG